jgi:hypothetical protein
MRDIMFGVPDHIYAYSCLKASESKDIALKSFQNSKAYKSSVEAFKNMFLPIQEEDPYNNMVFDEKASIQFDLMTSTRKNMHYKLDRIIENSKPKDTMIVILSLTALGNLDSIKRYYRIFREKKIGVLYIDYTREADISEYSTYDFALDERTDGYFERAFALVEQLTPNDIKSTRGRIGSDYTDDFRTAFWLYELFLIPENMAMNMVGMSKNGFHMKADNYEQTREYKTELTAMERFGISKTIKRNRPVPPNFDELIQYEQKCGNLEIACIDLKVPMIFPIDYQRLKQKQAGGKKELANCLKLYDQSLITDYEDWVTAGNAPTAFYKETAFYNECKEQELFFHPKTP